MGPKYQIFVWVPQCQDWPCALPLVTLPTPLRALPLCLHRAWKIDCWLRTRWALLWEEFAAVRIRWSPPVCRALQHNRFGSPVRVARWQAAWGFTTSPSADPYLQIKPHVGFELTRSPTRFRTRCVTPRWLRLLHLPAPVYISSMCLPFWSCGGRTNRLLVWVSASIVLLFPSCHHLSLSSLLSRFFFHTQAVRSFCLDNDNDRGRPVCNL